MTAQEKCASGVYREPSGITWNFVFESGSFINATRTDNACSISGGELNCINGFAAPVTLAPDLTCSVITTNYPWLVFEPVSPAGPCVAFPVGFVPFTSAGS